MVQLSFDEVSLGNEAERLYLNYALSVITARALPDVRDGLKPVQRRILYAMHNELRLGPDAKPKKCAAIVGDVMGKYHPHGDAPIYEALVRMAQSWVLRAPLVFGYGNFGSLDGDSPAAMRYTEARLEKLAMELLSELSKKTVGYRPNYDGTKFEPIVLPARFPNMLVNGASGIAVGMATDIPPHNLGEVIDGCVAMIEDPDISVKGLMKKIKGPDFPTGGELLNSSAELAEIYEAGKGTLKLRGEWKTEDIKGGQQVIITSIPYALEKRTLIEKIADVIVSKKLPGLVDVRDESTAEVRIVLELKKDLNPELVMAYLYKHTPLQSNVQVNLTCLIPTENAEVATPERLSLDRILRYFLDFRLETVKKRLEFDLAELRDRIHILEGFEKVFDALDEIIKIIRASEGKADAAQKIMKRFGLDEVQVDAILELKLYRLAKLEILIIQKEAKEKRAEAKRIAALLRNAGGLWDLVRSELEQIREQYADKRRTKILRGGAAEPEFSATDFIVEQDAVVIVTAQGWLKRQQTVKDLAATRIREGDTILAAQAGSTRAPIAFFSTQGSAYVARIADIPQSTGYGDPVQGIFKMGDGEKLVSVYAFDPRFLEVPPPTEGAPEPEPPYAVAVTRGGLAFRFSLRGHAEPSTRAGRKYARLKEGDEVLAVFPISEKGHVLAAATDGHAIAVDYDELPLLAGPGQGSMLIKLSESARLVAAAPESAGLRVLTESGKGYEITAAEHKLPRASKGVQVVKRAGFAKADVPLPQVPVLAGDGGDG